MRRPVTRPFSTSQVQNSFQKLDFMEGGAPFKSKWTNRSILNFVFRFLEVLVVSDQSNYISTLKFLRGICQILMKQGIFVSSLPSFLSYLTLFWKFFRLRIVEFSWYINARLLHRCQWRFNMEKEKGSREAEGSLSKAVSPLWYGLKQQQQHYCLSLKEGSLLFVGCSTAHY